jgi:PhnB protein
MSLKRRAVPPGLRTATPFLVVDDAAEAIDFYTRAFGAKEVMRVKDNGRISHAQFTIGNSRFMLSDEHPETGMHGPRTLGGSPLRIFLFVDNVDRFVGRAIAIGAKMQQPVDEKRYGDRSGSIQDPFGYTWHVATHRRDITPAEIRPGPEF